MSSAKTVLFDTEPYKIGTCVHTTQVLHPAAANININKRIWDVYFGDLLPMLVKEGSDGNCGSSACWDMLILQVILFDNLITSHLNSCHNLVLKP